MRKDSPLEYLYFFAVVAPVTVVGITLGLLWMKAHDKHRCYNQDR
jgi:hypothetical protein